MQYQSLLCSIMVFFFSLGDPLFLAKHWHELHNINRKRSRMKIEVLNSMDLRLLSDYKLSKQNHQVFDFEIGEA